MMAGQNVKKKYLMRQIPIKMLKQFKIIAIIAIIRRTSNYMYVLDPFRLQKVNKLYYRKYKPVRITQKEHLLIWNTETTQNNYLRNYQTETAIFLATKHEKTIMACSYLNFSMQKIHQNSKKWWLL